MLYIINSNVYLIIIHIFAFYGISIIVKNIYAKLKKIFIYIINNCLLIYRNVIYISKQLYLYIISPIEYEWIDIFIIYILFYIANELNLLKII